ncbi:Vesicle-associated protein 2-1 [Apostasia shenzhenica]|uniref:Vesicle-associated protein 2-1 n=1 Tax=Apostasia shenzhenica TaxID=1088818 RepID=A0A2I0ATM9_9ASPA|nr:Vesicle-associated protein 2-1 [Apostasia shenzhenica]
MGGGVQLISIHPEELTFEVEIEKPAYCNLKVVNNTEHHVAFKVKTTSPKKYFVRPNTSVVQPWDSCTITVTLQAQKEYPLDMQCKDKFLIQSTKVPPTIDIDEIPPDTFSKDGENAIEECKLRVVYVTPQFGHVNSEGESGVSSTSKFSMRGSDMLKNHNTEEIQAVQRLREERDATLQQNKQLQRELELLKRRRSRKSDAGFSLTFAAFAGLIGLLVGYILNLAVSSPST